MRGSINNRRITAHAVEQTPRSYVRRTVGSEGSKGHGASPTSILDGPGPASSDVFNVSSESEYRSSSNEELYSSESEAESEDSCCDSSESSDAEKQDRKPAKKQKTKDVQKTLAKNMNPGRRVIGGRIYDSILGETCHWCRQKTVEDHVACCKCPLKFCGLCLRNRHGEDIHEQRKAGVKWVCPRCRGGCGPGCSNCCNCGPCRKAQGLEPTGQLIREARAAGFSNVHDFLIGKWTGESEKIISLRKLGRCWIHVNGNTIPKCDDVPLRSVNKSKNSAGCNFPMQPYGQKMRGAIANFSEKRSVHVSSSVSAPATPPSSFVSHLNPKVGLPENQIKGEVSANLSCSVDNATPQLRVIQEKASPDVCIQSSLEASGRCSPSGNCCKVVRSLFNGLDDVMKTSGGSIHDSTFITRSFKSSNQSVQVKAEPVTADVISSINNDYSVNNFPCAGTHCDESGETQNINASLDEKLEKSIGQVKPDPSIGDTLSCKYKSDRADKFPCTVTQGSGCGKAHNQNTTLDNELQKSIIHGSKESENFPQKLQSVLDEPFDVQELEELWALATHQKPIIRYRETRQGSHEVSSSEQGFSYLDRQPDLALKLSSTMDPNEKLRLLRGFFCWLQCACMPGIFAPWVDRPAVEDDDCRETDGPDCEIIGVVLSVDEGETLQSAPCG